MTRDIPSDISDAAVKLIRTRKERHDLIVEGLLPRTSELLDGLPFMSCSIERDVIAWVQGRLLIDPNTPLMAAYLNLASNPCAESCKILLDANRGGGDLESDVDRLVVYQSCMGDIAAMSELKDQLLGYTVRSDVHSFSNFIRRCVGEGLKLNQRSMETAFAVGLRRVTDVADVATKLCAAMEWIASGEPSGELEKPARNMPPSGTDDDAAFLRSVEEDRGEVFKAPAGKMVVVPTFAAGASGHRRDLQRGWSGMDGVPLPLVGRGAVAQHRISLVGRWPHAADIIDVILGDLAAAEPVRFRPTLIVGPPGCGKTTLLCRIADVLGVPSQTVNLGGAIDSSAMGTSAQWHSAREAVPLQLIKATHIANPILIWDEVEKASADRKNGSALDAMLPMLERSQARNFRDPALEVDCDLSMVSHFATANSIDGIPGPLRDRMRILQMPEPGWQHLGALVDGIVWDLMIERDLDVRWIAKLAEDEMELVRRAWPGGSIRQLARIVQTLIAGREATWGQA